MSGDRFITGPKPEGWQGLQRVVGPGGSAEYLSWRDAQLRLNNREKYSRRQHENGLGYVYYVEPMTAAEIEREIAAAEEALRDHEKVEQRRQERLTEQMHEDNRRLRQDTSEAATGGADGPRGLGQTRADLQAQIDQRTGIPLVGGEDAVLQGGVSLRGRVGPKLPRIPGVKPPNEQKLVQIGQSCADEGDVSVFSRSKDLLKRFGISVGSSANVCVNGNQGVKRAAGEGADAILDQVGPLGERMNEGRLQQLEDALKKSGG
jgi:hypothetical protein